MDWKKSLALAVQARIPTIVWGAPGIGKTSAIYSIADGLGLHAECIIASLREPSDFAGLPIVAGQRVVLAPPAWAERIVARHEEGGASILFFDEISTAPPATQAALLRVVLERQVGDLKLPDDTAIVAAANPAEMAAGGWDLSAPLANRFCHITAGVDAGAWAEGIVGGFETPVPRLPSTWQEYLPQARATVAGFIKRRPGLLLAIPNSESERGQAWPSPRSWEMATRALAVTLATGEQDLALVAGCVGGAAVAELANYIRELDLPDPEELLADPDSFVMPARGDIAYATLAAVAAAARTNMTVERWLAAWQIIRKAADSAPDVAASAARSLARAHNSSLPVPNITNLAPVLRAAGLL